VVNDSASGVHESHHPKVRGLLIDTSVTRMVVAHQDRLSRFEPRYLEMLFVAQPRRGRSKS
jgi:predicted site-specific integrase-resolvase